MTERERGGEGQRRGQCRAARVAARHTGRMSNATEHLLLLIESLKPSALAAPFVVSA